eukprot:gene19896-21840_t
MKRNTVVRVTLILLTISENSISTWSSGSWTSSETLDNSASFTDRALDQIPATYHGIDMHRETYSETKATGTDFIDQHFFLCYHKDGRKTYYKKLNPTSFTNKRYWIITASGKFLVSMQLC